VSLLAESRVLRVGHCPMIRGKMDLSPKAFNLQLDRVDRLLGDADLTRELRDVIEGVLTSS
jgi:hypothetical protein